MKVIGGVQGGAANKIWSRLILYRLPYPVETFLVTVDRWGLLLWGGGSSYLLVQMTVADGCECS